jgi:hypothetical protein
MDVKLKEKLIALYIDLKRQVYPVNFPINIEFKN